MYCPTSFCERENSSKRERISSDRVSADVPLRLTLHGIRPRPPGSFRYLHIQARPGYRDRMTSRSPARWRGAVLFALLGFGLIAVLITRPLGGYGAATIELLAIAAFLYLVVYGERTTPDGRLNGGG